MSRAELTVVSLLVCLAGCVGGCADAFDTGVKLTPSRLRSVELTVGERFSACAKDPRVVARRVSREACAGADRFLRQASEGHRRACVSCHLSESDTALDVELVSRLFESGQRQPSFIAPLHEGSLMF
jgi:hypothetical protein